MLYLSPGSPNLDLRLESMERKEGKEVEVRGRYYEDS